MNDMLGRVLVAAMLAICFLVGVQVAQSRRLEESVRDLEMSVLMLQREYADLRLARESELMKLEQVER